MKRLLLLGLACAGFLGFHNLQAAQTRSTARAQGITVYAVSSQSCSLEQAKADNMVQALEAQKLPYTLHYIDQDTTAKQELDSKVKTLLEERVAQGNTSNLTVRFPVVDVNGTLLLGNPSVETIEQAQR
ncbi:MAG: hypothetical protein IGQ88_06545 [Gloeomargaritaceae cyanobacterium C42_A2020_066]|nr:hypothetical protein [Gloeomargaritaceae cyanobacterium C42_A2020_066]